MKDIEEVIYKMLTENTGVHMCDSGGENGRHWQRNQKKNLQTKEKKRNKVEKCYYYFFSLFL